MVFSPFLYLSFFITSILWMCRLATRSISLIKSLLWLEGNLSDDLLSALLVKKGLFRRFVRLCLTLENGRDMCKKVQRWRDYWLIHPCVNSKNCVNFSISYILFLGNIVFVDYLNVVCHNNTNAAFATWRRPLLFLFGGAWKTLSMFALSDDILCVFNHSIWRKQSLLF